MPQHLSANDERKYPSRIAVTAAIRCMDGSSMQRIWILQFLHKICVEFCKYVLSVLTLWFQKVSFEIKREHFEFRNVS